MDQGVRAMEGYSSLFRFLKLKPQHQILFSVTGHLNE